MASPGIPNQQGGGGDAGGGFDLNKLFKPSSNPLNMINMIQQQPPPQQSPSLSSPSSNTNNAAGRGNLTTSPSFPLPSSSSSPPYLAPASSFPPPTGPYHSFHPHYLSPYPPPSSPQLHQHHSPNQYNIHHQNRHQLISSYPTPPSIVTLSTPPPVSPNFGGSVLMDILTNKNQPPSSLSTNLSGPPFISGASSLSSSTSVPVPSAPSVSLASPTQQQSGPTPIRMLSSKLPKGRHLIGNHAVYDIDVRMQDEVQQQLEVTPITKYVSDPGLVFGHQIAVNRNYICYGLKPGAIRILNMNTALRSLLRGHNQKVTDMAFFAEDVHLLASACIDGRVFIWKINEGPDEEDKPQIFETVVLALQIVAEGQSVHPRLCWHPHKQEILMVAIGNHILKIDTNKVGKVEGFSAEEPLNCPIDKLIDGVQHVGKHDGEVTELSMCQWMTTRLASASADGTVKIWEDHKVKPLAVLLPHDGNPVNSAAFLTASDRPDHIVLITGGPLNQEVKIWASASEEGWLLAGDAESWQCTQTLTLKSSAESSVEDAFFNQVVALPRAGLFLLANAKKNAIYAIHLEYGPYPAATRMDYIAEFTVTMPILSLTGTNDSLSNGEHVVQVYCIQTQAIQQYALDLSRCLPPPQENAESEETESNVSRVFDVTNSDGSIMESSLRSNSAEGSVGNVSSIPPMISRSSESAPIVHHGESLASSEVISLPERATSSVETKPAAMQSHNSVENTSTVSPLLPSSPRLSQKLSGLRSPSNNIEPSVQLNDYGGKPSVLDYLVDQRVDGIKEDMAETPSLVESSGNSEKNIAQTDVTVVPEPPRMFKHPTHLVTPSEILSSAASSSKNSKICHVMNVGEAKVQDVIVNNDMESGEVEVKVIGETRVDQNNGFDMASESQITISKKKEKSFYSQASDLGIQMARDCCMENYAAEGILQANMVSITEGGPPNSGEDEDHDTIKDVPPKVGEPETSIAVPQSTASAVKGKKQKGKASHLSGPSSPSPSPFNSTGSSDEPGCSSAALSNDAILSQLLALQDRLVQVTNKQKEMQKQMNTMISVPVSKDGKSLETSLGRSIEKVLRANIDALWARFQEENAKHEKLELDRTQQLTNLITNSLNKDLPSALEKTLKKEIAAVGPVVACAITPALEKSISSAIAESFQKCMEEKAVNQLEKAVCSKLDATLARQLQLQFQTSGKQALQDALRSTLEASVIPAFEMSCKAMFDQVDSTFQKGFVTHINSAQQHLDTPHSPLAIALRDALSSASSITQTLTGDLADGQRKLLAIAAAGADSRVGNPSVPMSNGSLPGSHQMAEAPFVPTKELSRLITESKYEEAFTAALHRSDVSIVSWLCSQVDLQWILSMSPLPLSQGVLLALLQQLACDIAEETSRKLEWMRDVAAAINPTDPMIVMHVRPIFDQVYQILGHQRNLPTASASEVAGIRVVMLIINSVLMSCK